MRLNHKVSCVSTCAILRCVFVQDLPFLRDTHMGLSWEVAAKWVAHLMGDGVPFDL